MAVRLDDSECAMLNGERGPAGQMAMSILVRMADIFDAPSLLGISGAHIDSTIYIGEGGLEYAERLATLGARVAVPTTLNVSGLDEHHWQEWAVPSDWAAKSRRQMVAYQSMGTLPTWTCAPYQTETKPRFGQQIAWGESNAIVFANSVIGARTERYPDLLDICCAITGRVPAFGLHLTENRAGDILLELRDIPLDLQRDDSFFPVLGHLMGKVARDSIPVIEGLAVVPTEDQLKALGAAAASSGTVALFHIIGITPEAPTLEAAFRGHKPAHTVDVTMDLLRIARRQLTTSSGDSLDMVVLGSPHFSLAEFKQLVPLLTGKRKHPNVKLLVTTNRAVAQFARQAGLLDAVQAFGGQITVDTCILASPMLPADTKTLMTNSGKYAYYAPGMLNTQVAFGSLADCVESAIQGRIVRDESLWGPAPSDGQLPEPDLSSTERRGGETSRRAVISGEAQGEALVSREPLSFWGGYDYHTGEIIDRRHPLAGSIASAKILALPFTRGSSTTTAVLLEAIRAGTAPAAIVTTGIDSFFALASIVADVMYGKFIPIVALTPREFTKLENGQPLQVLRDGAVMPSPRASG